MTSNSSPSQYALISQQWPELHAEALRVEECALRDPRTACFYARRTIELLVEWVYDNDSQLRSQYGSVADLLYAIDFREFAGDEIGRLCLIKDLGKKADHGIEPIQK